MGRVGGRSAQLKGGCVWVIVQLLTEWPECAVARLYKCSFGDLCGYLIRCQGRLVGGVHVFSVETYLTLTFCLTHL